jgi:hypothetical protein
LSDPTKPTDVGKNRTGVAASPIDAPQTAEGASEDYRKGAPGTPDIHTIRLSYSQRAEPVGTMPPPLTIKGMAKTAISKLKGRSPNVFIDKLGERLAFERGGVRLYEALLVKLQASHNPDPSLTIEALREIHDDELRHVGVLRRAIEHMGADPTAMTPCADVTGVAASGFVQVLSDPRTTLTQCLGVMLQVEVADAVTWELLVELAAEMGQDDLADEFRQAMLEEQRHVDMVRRWTADAVLGQAGGTTAEPVPPPVP